MHNNEASQHGANGSAYLSQQAQGISPAQPHGRMFPVSIQQNGLIQTRLRDPHAYAIDPKRQNKLNDDLEKLRQKGIPNPLAIPAEMRNSFFTANDSISWGGCDAVLQYVVSIQEGYDYLLGRLEREAETTYLKAPSFYNCLFLDLFPETFREKVDPKVYDNGSNPLAVGDLNVFFSRLWKRRERASDSGQVGLPSGVAALDDMLCGLSGLTFLAGPKGVGKTSLVMSAVWETLTTRKDVAVLFYSLDLPKDRIYERLLCRAWQVTYRQLTGIQQLTDHDKDRWQHAQETLHELTSRLRVIERDYGSTEIRKDDTVFSVKNGLTFDRLVADSNELRRETETQHLLIVIDMLSKWNLPSNVGSEVDPDQYRLDVLDQFRQCFRRSLGHDGVTMIATSEQRKDAGNEPTIDDVKGDGRIGSDADNVLLMWPKRTVGDGSDEPVPITLRIAKSRDGGRRGDLNLLFDHVNYRFLPADTEPDRGTRRRRVGPTTVDPYGT